MEQSLTPSTETEPDVTAHCDWQFAECARAIRHITNNRPQFPWLRWARKVTVIALVLVLLLLGLGFTRTGWDGVIRSLPWLVLILLWLVLLAGGYSWITAWQIKRNNPAMVSGQIHHISRDGYRVTCGPITSQAEWAGLLRVVETPEFFLAFPVRNAAYFLPKRCLSSGDVATARALFRAHLAGRSLLLAV